MEIKEIDKFIVSDELFSKVKGLDDKKIKELLKKQNTNNLSTDEKKLIKDTKVYFGDDFFNLSKTGREDRIKTVDTQNSKLKEIKEKLNNHLSKKKSLEERKNSGETTVDGKNIDDAIKSENDSLNKTINSVKSLEAGAKTSDILKQTLSKWETGWNFYKKGVEERYNHPWKYTLKRVAIPAVTALLGGWVFFASVGAITYFAARTAIAQNRKKAGYNPNLDALKSNFFTGKNSLRNALFKKKSADKIISAVKGIDLGKVDVKAKDETSDTSDKSKDKDSDSTSMNIDKLIEEINSIVLDDRSYENINKMDLLCKQLDTFVKMGIKIPEDERLQARIKNMHNIIAMYIGLMNELEKAYSKKDDKSLENMKYLNNLVNNIKNELRSLPDDKKNKFSEICGIVEKFSNDTAKLINDTYAKLGDSSEENMKELIQFCDQIDNYMFIITDAELKNKVKEIKKKVDEYKNTHISDDEKNKSNKDKPNDNKDAKRLLFEENRKTLRNSRIDNVSVASIPKENINNLRSFADSIRPYVSELDNVERHNYDEIVDMIKKWDKINTNREFLRNCNVTELRDLPNETLNWISKRISELEDIKKDLSIDEKEKMDTIEATISGYINKRKLFMQCRENWKNISAYSKVEITDDEQCVKICEIIDAMMQFKNELTAEEQIKLNKYVDAKNSYLMQKENNEKLSKLIKDYNSELNSAIKSIDIVEIGQLTGLNSKERDLAINNMRHENAVKVSKDINKIKRISAILRDMNDKGLTSMISIRDKDKFQEIINLGIVNIKKSSIPDLDNGKSARR